MKTHLLLDVVSPTEDDPYGEQELACGRDFAESAVRDKSHVTCCDCIRVMSSPPIPKVEYAK